MARTYGDPRGEFFCQVPCTKCEGGGLVDGSDCRSCQGTGAEPDAWLLGPWEHDEEFNRAVPSLESYAQVERAISEPGQRFRWQAVHANGLYAGRTSTTADLAMRNAREALVIVQESAELLERLDKEPTPPRPRFLEEQATLERRPVQFTGRLVGLDGDGDLVEALEGRPAWTHMNLASFLEDHGIEATVDHSDAGSIVIDIEVMPDELARVALLHWLRRVVPATVNVRVVEGGSAYDLSRPSPPNEIISDEDLETALPEAGDTVNLAIDGESLSVTFDAPRTQWWHQLSQSLPHSWDISVQMTDDVPGVVVYIETSGMIDHANASAYTEIVEREIPDHWGSVVWNLGHPERHISGQPIVTPLHPELAPTPSPDQRLTCGTCGHLEWRRLWERRLHYGDPAVMRCPNCDRA